MVVLMCYSPSRSWAAKCYGWLLGGGEEFLPQSAQRQKPASVDEVHEYNLCASAVRFTTIKIQ